MSGGLFTRRGVYSPDEKVDRLRTHQGSALHAAAAELKLAVPDAFLQARTASEALAVLSRALGAGAFVAFVERAFASLGPFGDEGHVVVRRLSGDAAPTVRRPLLADDVGHDLNAQSVAPAIGHGRPLSRAILEETFVEHGQAGLRLRFEDPDRRTVVENGVPVERIEYLPVPVDVLYDVGRRALFVHGGTRLHVIRATQLVSGALQGQAGGAVVFEPPPALSEPILYAIVDALGGVNPGGELKPFDISMRRFRYGTSTAEDVRLNETGQRIKSEGLARDVEANVPHRELVRNGPDRTVRLRIDEHWEVRLRDTLEPDGYFALYDHIQRWYAVGSWLRPLGVLARAALERTNVAVSQVDITDHARRVRDDLIRALGALVPSDAKVHQRDMMATLAANALIRAVSRAGKLRAGKEVALGPDLVRFLNDHAAIGGVTLDEVRRSALVRHVWRMLEQADGDLLRFVESADTA